MNKCGINSYLASMEAQAATNNVKGGIYGGAGTEKPQRIHIHIADPLNETSIRMGTKRCACGGWTFSTTWGGEKVVCRHCGKVYVRKEFDTLPSQSLTPSEREDRRIFGMLLAGGDLREDPVKDVLVLKDRMGLPAGELPMEYAKHLEDTYRDARVVVNRRKSVSVVEALRLYLRDMELAAQEA